ncbi:MAG: hypothetical protein WCH83_00025 [Alphaproteobacteria bacterium]
MSVVTGARIRLAALSSPQPIAPDPAARLVALGPPDRHDRVPVIAFDGQGSVEARLLRDGLARLTVTRLVPRPCWAHFESAETEAVRDRRGLWAAPAALIAATNAEALKAAAGRFIIAEGRVISVRTLGRITYVNFGRADSGALTATINERDLPRFRERGLEPAAFRGHILRVRGTVSFRRGPVIAAAIPEAMTIASGR